VYGPTAVNVYHLLEALRQQGELYTIGAEVGRCSGEVQWGGAVGFFEVGMLLIECVCGWQAMG
jgi:hypothetical protein